MPFTNLFTEIFLFINSLEMFYNNHNPNTKYAKKNQPTSNKTF